MVKWVECWVHDVVKKCKLGIAPEDVIHVSLAVDQVTWTKKLILEYQENVE